MAKRCMINITLVLTTLLSSSALADQTTQKTIQAAKSEVHSSTVDDELAIAKARIDIAKQNADSDTTGWQGMCDKFRNTEKFGMILMLAQANMLSGNCNWSTAQTHYMALKIKLVSKNTKLNATNLTSTLDSMLNLNGWVRIQSTTAEPSELASNLAIGHEGTPSKKMELLTILNEDLNELDSFDDAIQEFINALQSWELDEKEKQNSLMARTRVVTGWERLDLSS